MPIIDIFQGQKKQIQIKEESILLEESPAPIKVSLISAICARLFFVLLFGVVMVWFVFSVLKLLIQLVCSILFIGSSLSFRDKIFRSIASCKRAIVCFLSLLFAIVSPSLGILIACAYFFMYDKNGVEEVFPSSLKEQFKDLFAEHSAKA